MTDKNHNNHEIPPHGGDVYQIARGLGLPPADLLDFSANINPLGFPARIVQVIQETLPEIVHYPDHRCLALRQALAGYHQVTPESILVGNGSTQLIYLVARALGASKALIVTPAFSEYEAALQMAGVPADFFLTREVDNFTLAQPLEASGADLVFLANPASPSGALLPLALIFKTLRALAKTGGYLLLDETFIDFVEEASIKEHLGRFPNLIILRSFTKFFGIPGLRLGYLLATPKIVARLAADQEPWSVNTLAQAVGLACLADRHFIAASRALIQREREFLLKELRAIPGLQVFQGTVNYLLVKLTQPGWTATRLRHRMLTKRLVIRHAGNFKGLDERFFRVAVRRRQENQKLLKALRLCLMED